MGSKLRTYHGSEDSGAQAAAQVNEDTVGKLTLATATKLHAAIGYNNTGSDMYVIVSKIAPVNAMNLEDIDAIAVSPLIPTGEVGNIDYGSSGRPMSTPGFFVFASSTINVVTIVQMDRTINNSWIDVTYS